MLELREGGHRRHEGSGAFARRHQKLNEAIVELVDDFSLVMATLSAQCLRHDGTLSPCAHCGDACQSAPNPPHPSF